MVWREDEVVFNNTSAHAARLVIHQKKCANKFEAEEKVSKLVTFLTCALEGLCWNQHQVLRGDKWTKAWQLNHDAAPMFQKKIDVLKNWKWNWGELLRFCCPLPQQEGTPQNDFTMIVVNPRLNWNGFKHQAAQNAKLWLSSRHYFGMLRQHVGCVVADFVQRHVSTREVPNSQSDILYLYNIPLEVESQIVMEFPVGYTISDASLSWNFQPWKSEKLSTFLQQRVKSSHYTV